MGGLREERFGGSVSGMENEKEISDKEEVKTTTCISTILPVSRRNSAIKRKATTNIINYLLSQLTATMNILVLAVSVRHNFRKDLTYDTCVRSSLCGIGHVVA